MHSAGRTVLSSSRGSEMAFAKGIFYERELKKILEGKGFFVTRASGSGADGSSPDLIVLHTTKKFALECKAWKQSLRIAPEKVQVMKEWQNTTGIPVYIAWRIIRQWRFFPLDALDNVGKAFGLKLGDAATGMTVEDITK